MTSHRGFKQGLIFTGRSTPVRYYAIAMMILLSLYVTWTTTMRLEEAKKDSSTGRSPFHVVKKARSRPANTSYDLMIFSYMRSGSTMTGEVFKENEDFFFVFEPLLSILPYQYFTTTDICKMRNLDCSPEEFSQKLNDAMTLLHNIYNCDLRHIQSNALEYIVKENKSGSSWVEFSKCASNALRGTNLTIKSVVENSETTYVIDTCFENLEKSCRKSRARVTKVLRLSMRLIPKMLAQLPDLKILLLVRDPRAVINSRLITDWFPICEKDWYGVFENARSLCKKMMDDINALHNIKQNFPERLVIHRLEDVVIDPPKLFQGIFDFMKLRDMDVEMERIRIKYINKNYDGFIGKWKTMLKDKFAKMVNENCDNVLRYYEYTL